MVYTNANINNCVRNSHILQFMEAKCLYLPLSWIKPPASGADWLPAFNSTTSMESIGYQCSTAPLQ